MKTIICAVIVLLSITAYGRGPVHTTDNIIIVQQDYIKALQHSSTWTDKQKKIAVAQRQWLDASSPVNGHGQVTPQQAHDYIQQGYLQSRKELTKLKANHATDARIKVQQQVVEMCHNYVLIENEEKRIKER